MAIELMCRKIGMTQLFSETGECIPVTVLDAAPNRVVQKKTEKRDGYSALQLGFGARRPSRTSKAARGHCEKAGVAPQRYLHESRVGADEAGRYEAGQEINVGIFSQGERIDVIGTSKGRGTAGVVKRHHFSIKRKTHGTHEFFRHGGSIGAGSYPGHVLKGLGMPGRMGAERVTTLNVEVVRVDSEKGLLFVRGGVPGHNNALVRIRSSVRAER
ncbi:MAG: 50S ribosomal protein L3 [Myxococcales bacterium]|nr:50S ribosomal protein L3 [Myxococcales bacterium]MDH5566410.1 50S ribosomal protein L3 [Myxococcales bacterium]